MQPSGLQPSGDNPLEFPDLWEATQLAAREREEDGERTARELRSAALLAALRSFKAGEFRPGALCCALCCALCAAVLAALLRCALLSCAWPRLALLPNPPRPGPTQSLLSTCLRLPSPLQASLGALLRCWSATSTIT